MIRRRLAALAVAGAVAVVVFVLTGCGVSSTPPSGQSGSQTAKTGIRGTKLSDGIPKPALTLTDTAGAAWNFSQRTDKRVTLLYFGYTHCPDVCPTTMADIAVALRGVPAQVRSHVTVVFVTTDPARDTAPVIKHWLASFSSTFVGLTGPMATIYAAADKVGVPLEKPKKEKDGSITVSHGAQVLAFGADNQAHYVYTEGTTSDTYAHDLTLLTQEPN